MTSIGGSSNVPPPPPPPPVDRTQLAGAAQEVKKLEASTQNQDAAKISISEAGRAAQVNNAAPPEQVAKPEAAPQAEAPNAIDPALLNRAGASPAQAQQGPSNGVKELLR